MYREHFSLARDPFEMSPDPDFLFLTGSHREALSGLTYGVLAKKGFVLLTGDAGTGKTTLLRQVLRTVPSQMSLVINPRVTPDEFLELAMLTFGIRDLPDSKARRLLKFEEFLRASEERGQVSVLMVDEAQQLDPSVLEEIRLLTNFETHGSKLLQVVLSGQNELRGLLNRHDLRQFKQRIALRVTLEPLAGSAEVGQYIRFRWQRAGGQEPPFDDDAVALVAAYSSGIPRIVNTICDNALLAAFAQGSRRVSREPIEAIAQEMDLGPSDGRTNVDGESARVQQPGPSTTNNALHQAFAPEETFPTAAQTLGDLPKPNSAALRNEDNLFIGIPTIERYCAAAHDRSLRGWVSRLLN